jgi:2-polyprenyl-3-methyl-5-hydroxy-6-metoxy-1,4-benzoquinol methylase
MASPELFFTTINAYQRTEALKAALEIALFTAIGPDGKTAAEIATACAASERGIRILSDYMTICGFLVKEGDTYRLTEDSAVFLDRNSSAYLGGTTRFLASPDLVDHFSRLADAVRRGGTADDRGGTTVDEFDGWVKFARGMAPMMRPASFEIAELVDPTAEKGLRILDIAAGHGLFGIAFAQRNPGVTVVAQDWGKVLDVAFENATAAGVADRYERLPGSAFDVSFGEGYDVVLLTNFLHHFDIPTCVGLLKKVRAALAPGGRVATLEFVPNEDRVTPMTSAAFSLVMLASTPGGDAYTFSELAAMFAEAGFSRSELFQLHRSPAQAVMSYV